MAALHVGSERLLAGFDDWTGVSHARRLEGSADYELTYDLIVILIILLLWCEL